MRDRRNDSILLSGSSNGSLAIVRASVHSKCLTLIRFIWVFVLFNYTSFINLFRVILFDCSKWFICRRLVLLCL